VISHKYIVYLANDLPRYPHPSPQKLATSHLARSPANGTQWYLWISYSFVSGIVPLCVIQ